MQDMAETGLVPVVTGEFPGQFAGEPRRKISMAFEARWLWRMKVSIPMK
jgi:hypothetical protein